MRYAYRSRMLGMRSRSRGDGVVEFVRRQGINWSWVLVVIAVSVFLGNVVSVWFLALLLVTLLPKQGHS